MEKDVKLFSIILLILTLSIGISLSFYSWNTTLEEETDIDVSFKGAEIVYYGGPDIMNVTLNPTDSKEGGIKKDIKVNLTQSTLNDVNINFILTLEEFNENLKNASFKWEFYKNNAKINEGTFENVNEKDIVILTNEEVVTDVIDTYTLYLWIDGNVLNPSSMQANNFKFKLGATSNNY